MTIAGREAVTHELKTWPEYFAKILDGSKRFELRNSDRDFRVGDLLRLREWRLTDNEYTGREITVRVTYLTTDTNWMNGYSVAMSIKPVADKPTPPADGKMIAVGEGRDYDEIGVPIGLREMTISQEAADQIDRIMREPSRLDIVPKRIESVGEGQTQAVLALAADIREVDGGHSLGAAELAEKLIERGWHPATAETERPKAPMDVARIRLLALVETANAKLEASQTELTTLREQLATAERERDAADKRASDLMELTGVREVETYKRAFENCFNARNHFEARAKSAEAENTRLQAELAAAKQTITQLNATICNPGGCMACGDNDPFRVAKFGMCTADVLKSVTVEVAQP